MKINYVPGLALRLFPGLSREPVDAVTDYIATNSKIAIFTGTAPSEDALWAMGNFDAYVTANTDKLVYQETTGLKFTYDGYKHKRVIQKWPVDSTPITPLVSPIAQDQALIDLGSKTGAIPTPNNLYALVYCPDKDTTLNTPAVTGNDLIMLIPGVGSSSTDFCSLNTTNFVANDSMYFRNLTVSLFQGYQVTDTLITEQVEDPENPGETTTEILGSKKSLYLNKVWGNRLSEAYRDCFISRPIAGSKYAVGISNPTISSFANTPGARSYFNDFGFSSGNGYLFDPYLREFDPVLNTWKASYITISLINRNIFSGFIVSQAVIDLIDEINNKSILGTLPNYKTLIEYTGVGSNIDTPPNLTTGTPSRIYMTYNYYNSVTLNQFNNHDPLPGLLVKYLIHQSWYSETLRVSYRQLMIELGFDESLVDRAIKSMAQLNLDISKWSSTFDKDSGILTVQNSTPAKLLNRFKKSTQNPTNEALYILLPRYMIRQPFETIFGEASNINYATDGVKGSSISSVSFPRTQKVIDGENVDYTTQRVRITDYTAISIGVTGNGNTDLEYDSVDIIDYIDSLTVMVKIPNKF